MESMDIYTTVLQEASAKRIGAILDLLDQIKENLVKVNTENFSEYAEARDLNDGLVILLQGLNAFALTTAMAAALSESKE